jgi:hypothetical protein
MRLPEKLKIRLIVLLLQKKFMKNDYLGKLIPQHKAIWKLYDVSMKEKDQLITHYCQKQRFSDKSFPRTHSVLLTFLCDDSKYVMSFNLWMCKNIHFLIFLKKNPPPQKKKPLLEEKLVTVLYYSWKQPAEWSTGSLFHLKDIFSAFQKL